MADGGRRRTAGDGRKLQQTVAADARNSGGWRWTAADDGGHEWKEQIQQWRVGLAPMVVAE